VQAKTYKINLLYHFFIIKSEFVAVVLQIDVR